MSPATCGPTAPGPPGDSPPSTPPGAGIGGTIESGGLGGKGVKKPHYFTLAQESFLWEFLRSANAAGRRNKGSFGPAVWTDMSKAFRVHFGANLTTEQLQNKYFYMAKIWESVHYLYTRSSLGIDPITQLPIASDSVKARIVDAHPYTKRWFTKL